MVEFAILLPFLVLLLTIALDFCRVFYHYTIVTNCARNAALYASDQTTEDESPHYTAGDRAASIRKAALDDAGDIKPDEREKIEVTFNAVSVTVSYPVPMVTSYLGMTSKTVGRTVYMNAAPESPNF